MAKHEWAATGNVRTNGVEAVEVVCLQCTKLGYYARGTEVGQVLNDPRTADDCLRPAPQKPAPIPPSERTRDPETGGAPS